LVVKKKRIEYITPYLKGTIFILCLYFVNIETVLLIFFPTYFNHHKVHLKKIDLGSFSVYLWQRQLRAVLLETNYLKVDYWVCWTGMIIKILINKSNNV